MSINNLVAKISELTIEELIELDKILERPELDGKLKMTEHFETLFAKKFDFTREDTSVIPFSYYKDPVASAALAGFLRSLKEMRHLSIKRRISGKVRGPFIIGRAIDDDTVQFGYRPFIQANVKKATEEAARLSEIHGGKYIVFGSLVSVGKKRQPAEESRQGVKIIKPNPTRVMADFQEFRKQYPLELSPTEMMVTQEGKFKVTGFISEDPVTYTFETFDDYISFINNWLKATKMLLKAKEK